MKNCLRLSQPGDEEELKDLWHTVFGDDRRYIDRFFEHAYTPGTALVMEADGIIASMVFLLPIGKLVTPENPGGLPCTVSYAFATRENFRRHGFGKAIANEAVKQSEEAGNPVNTICPAEDSLFGYYSGRVGYHDFFYTEEQEFTRCALSSTGSIPPVKDAGAGAYSAMRSSLLSGRAYIAFSEKFMRYQETLCRQSGGGLFLLNGENYTACAAVEMAAGKTAFVKELLVPKPHFMDALAALADILPAEKFFVRTPAEAQSSGRRFAMMKAKQGMLSGSFGGAPAWYGFAFD